MYACFAEHMAVHLGMGMHARISVCMAVCMVICMAVCMVLGMALCVNLCMAVCMNLNIAESKIACSGASGARFKKVQRGSLSVQRRFKQVRTGFAADPVRFTRPGSKGLLSRGPVRFTGPL